VKSKKAAIINYYIITNYYIEQSWSVSLKNIGRHNFVHNSHRTQCNPMHATFSRIRPTPIQSNPIHGWIQSMDISGSQGQDFMCPRSLCHDNPTIQQCKALHNIWNGPAHG